MITRGQCFNCELIYHTDDLTLINRDCGLGLMCIDCLREEEDE